MYIWRRRITPEWLEQRNEDLVRRFGSALAIIEQPGKARTLVEVSCGTRKEAAHLQREFGGTIEKLRLLSNNSQSEIGEAVADRLTADR
jgi:hypothetical protein